MAIRVPVVGIQVEPGIIGPYVVVVYAVTESGTVKARAYDSWQAFFESPVAFGLVGADRWVVRAVTV